MPGEFHHEIRGTVTSQILDQQLIHIHIHSSREARESKQVPEEW